MWRMCVRTVLADTTSSDATSEAVRLLGRYLRDAQLGVAQLIAQRSGRAALRQGAR